MTASGVGDLVAGWRRTRRLSQQELAGRAAVSGRHLSFVETGRARPGAGLLRRLAEALDLSCRDTNELLVVAGYAPMFGETRLDEPAMAPVRRALDLMLEHTPYPASVLDGRWNLLLANPAQQALIAAIEAEGGPLPDTTNVLELVFHPEGFRPFIVNWEAVAGFLLRRLRRDLDLRADPGLARLHRRLDELADCQALLAGAPPAAAPLLAVSLALGGRRLNLFSTLASFGTALDVVVEELRIEQYFPADDASADFFRQSVPPAALAHRTDDDESV